MSKRPPIARAPRLRCAGLALCALSAWLGWAGGCGVMGLGGADEGPAPHADAGDRSAGQPAEIPVVRGAGAINGIEVRTWTIDPLGGPLARALATQIEAEGDTLPDASTAKWRARGFRVVEIPIELVASLEASLPHVDSVRRLWLGQPTAWTPLATRRLESDRGLLGARPTPVRASLVVRSWIEPGVRRPPVRVELALSGVPLDGTGASAILMDGLLLERRLEPGRALIVVPVAPGEIWHAHAEGADPPLQAARNRRLRPGDKTRPEPVAGPDPIETSSGSGPDSETRSPSEPEGGVAVLLPPPPPDLGGTPVQGEAPVQGDAPGGLLAEAAGPFPQAAPLSLGESLLITPGRIRSNPPRPAREVLLIVPASR